MTLRLFLSSFQTLPAALARLVAFSCGIFLAAFACGASEASPDWVPDISLVTKIEASLHLPDGAASLSSYTRYYAGTIKNGHRILLGHFEAGSGKVQIVRSVRELPVIYDGGCSIVSIRYDVTAERVLDLFCNGVA
jgi:hypothetical protein